MKRFLIHSRRLGVPYVLVAFIVGFWLVGMAVDSPLGAQDDEDDEPPPCEMDLCLEMTDCEDTRFAQTGCAYSGDECDTYWCEKPDSAGSPH